MILKIIIEKRRKSREDELLIGYLNCFGGNSQKLLGIIVRLFKDYLVLLTTALWHWLFSGAAFLLFVMNNGEILVFAFALVKGDADAECARRIAKKYEYGDYPFQEEIKSNEKSNVND